MQRAQKFEYYYYLVFAVAVQFIIFSLTGIQVNFV